MNLLETKHIKIGEKDYPVKMTTRSLMLYETLTKHDISIIDTLEERVTFFYCAFKGGGSELTYDQFLDLIDDKPESIGTFINLYLEKAEKKQPAR